MGAVKSALLDLDSTAPDYTESPCPHCGGEGITLTDTSPYAVETLCDACQGTGTILELVK